MGMLSLIDAILAVPIGVVIEELCLEPAIKAQLLGCQDGEENDPFADLRSDAGERSW